MVMEIVHSSDDSLESVSDPEYFLDQLYDERFTNSENGFEEEESGIESLYNFSLTDMVKHPLQHTWVLCLYNFIQKASSLPNNSDFYYFKEGVRPMWEDPRNKNGGRWIIRIDRSEEGRVLDECWLDLVMAVLGEQFSGLGAEICGVAVNVRSKGHKVCLWTANADSDENREIGYMMHSLLDSASYVKFERHLE
ncbi:eukaryotic initiation factor 4E [Trichinella nativa]|uniref:eIF-4F 25 kDa subunit n=1 Tax=Trichinella nativa TaxID=6335 RepID=A0A1Y3F328_9BILA|nr:eukaryotic initiation factor 4E [Trichinella nativa]